MANSSKTRRRTAIIGGGVGAAMVLSFATNGALAATSAPSAPTSNTACPATPGVTPTTVTLAEIGDVTGTGGPIYLGSPQAFQLRIDQENAKGGVNGRKIVTKIYDDQTSPTVQIAMAQKAVQQDNVFAISTNSTQAGMYQFLKDSGIPVTSYTSSATGTDRNAFGVLGASTASQPQYATTAQLQKLKDLGVTKLANVSISAPSAVAGQTAFTNLVALAGGSLSQVLKISDENAGLHDATSTALRIKNSGADGLTVVGLESSISIAQAVKQQGVALKAFFTAGLADPLTLKAAGGTLDGAIGSNYGTVPIGINRRSIKTFTAGMKAAGLNPYLASGPMAYVGADLLITGLKLAGKCPTRASFIDNLRKVTKYDANGLLASTLNFTPGIMPNGNPSLCTWYMLAKGNDLVPDPKPTCGQLIDTTTGKVVLS